MENYHMDNNQAETTQVETTTVNSPNEKYLKSRKIVYYILGILELLLGFRLVFKLLGANPTSAFISFIYNVSGVFLTPFNSIFRTAVNDGIETKSVLEPANIIAMIVFAIVAYCIITFIKIYSTPKSDKKTISQKYKNIK